MVLNSLSFCMSVKLLISPSYLNEILAGWFDPWLGKTPWRRKWQPAPVLLPGKSYGWRSLVGYSQWGHKELDVTERLNG